MTTETEPRTLTTIVDALLDNAKATEAVQEALDWITRASTARDDGEARPLVPKKSLVKLVIQDGNYKLAGYSTSNLSFGMRPTYATAPIGIRTAAMSVIQERWPEFLLIFRAKLEQQMSDLTQERVQLAADLS